MDPSPGHCQGHLPGGWFWGDISGPAQGERDRLQEHLDSLLAGSPFPPFLGCSSLTFPSHCRMEAEPPPRPASPKVNRSTPEVAPVVEDQTKRSECWRGARGNRRAVGRQRYREGLGGPRWLCNLGSQYRRRSGMIRPHSNLACLESPSCTQLVLTEQ